MKRFVAFTVPFFLIHAANLLWLKYTVAKSDSVEGLMTLGQNWIELNPLRVFHQPGTIWAELSALILLITGPTVWKFEMVGIGIQLIVVVVVGYWMSNQMVDTVTLLTISCLTAFMPTTLALSRTWNEYYTFLVLMPALAIMFHTQRYGVFFWLGLMMANLFTVIPLALAAVVFRWERRLTITLMTLLLGFLIGANVMVWCYPLSFIAAVLGQGIYLPHALTSIPAPGEYGIQPERWIALPATGLVCYLALQIHEYRRWLLLALVLIFSAASLSLYVQDQLEYLKFPVGPAVHSLDQYRTGIV